MKHILLLNGNPKEKSFSKQLSDRYEIAATEYAQVRRFDLSTMEFNPNLVAGYDQKQFLEPALVQFQQALLWAEHIVIVSPIWWGGLPAKLKGLFDRTFLPGFAFSYEQANPLPTPHLCGKSARIILTMDAPSDFMQMQAKPVLEQLDVFTLQFCGIEKAAVSLFGGVIVADEAQRNTWLQDVRNFASHGG
ncbi:NAD(P)H-dependent oxidoreductase [Pseudoalteromonas byunsanensis]|uniref:Oxidoreductase n=1 Tax=Pseudoalteromonas byunsanensis TaxID=327939 RepID=A0A1S1N4J1_9GAMM|nr:NAD(P)H-dependent oxidoreductase [Pseudoalteromonas byunsanensis]OHU96025.1 oxidoreductase [Pseudoalteromonas byunsanensis]